MALESPANTLQSILESIDQKLHDYVASDNAKLSQMLSYVFFPSGKRMRPLLAACVGLDKCNLDSFIDVICSLELIHTYSLVHDDLPCMDDDDYRRGKPSAHIAFSEADAVLLGDYLLTNAFDIIGNCTLSDQKKIAILRILSKNSKSMVIGQILDIENKDKDLPYEKMLDLYKKKTADLIIAALEIGAIIADYNVEKTATLLDFGCNFGLLFQLLDDFEDNEMEKFHSHIECFAAKSQISLKKLNNPLLEEFFSKTYAKALI